MDVCRPIVLRINDDAEMQKPQNGRPLLSTANKCLGYEAVMIAPATGVVVADWRAVRFLKRHF